jgi:hypothetical protein
MQHNYRGFVFNLVLKEVGIDVNSSHRPLLIIRAIKNTISSLENLSCKLPR